jgi:hypothetical protein
MTAARGGLPVVTYTSRGPLSHGQVSFSHVLGGANFPFIEVGLFSGTPTKKDCPTHMNLASGNLQRLDKNGSWLSELV